MLPGLQLQLQDIDLGILALFTPRQRFSILQNQRMASHTPGQRSDQ